MHAMTAELALMWFAGGQRQLPDLYLLHLLCPTTRLLTIGYGVPASHSSSAGSGLVHFCRCDSQAIEFHFYFKN